MMYYTQNGNAIGLSRSGDIIILSQEELEFIHDLNKKRHKPTVAELAEMFPQAGTSIKELIKEKRRKIVELRELGWWWKGWVNKQPMTPASKEMYSTLLCEVHSNYPISELEKEIESLERVLSFIKMKGQPMKGEGNLILAKSKPISDYIEFNRSGFSRCLWHIEKTGSLKYDKKTNRVYCFGACGKGYDVVDVVQKLFNYSFQDAIRFLSK